MSTLASALILSIILFMLASAVVVFLSFTLASALAVWVGTTGGYAIIAAFYVLVALAVIVNRKRWIVAPVVNFIATVMLSDDADDDGTDSL